MDLCRAGIPDDVKHDRVRGDASRLGGVTAERRIAR